MFIIVYVNELRLIYILFRVGMVLLIIFVRVNDKFFIVFFIYIIFIIRKIVLIVRKNNELVIFLSKVFEILKVVFFWSLYLC